MNLTVLYVDNHLLAVWKPAGLLTQGDRTGDPSLLDWAKVWLVRTYDKPGRVFLGLLHRLDRPVAGVVLFARTSKAAGRMSEQFRTRVVDKTYRALIEGRIEPASGELHHFIEPRGEGSVRVHDSPGPRRKPAKLSYRTLSAAAAATLVELKLMTGRKHQIRAQFARMGHPIVGDLRYGAQCALADEGIALVARRLDFVHPVSKQAISIEVPEELCPLATLLTAAGGRKPLQER
jgi:23S rRNA pseudouridine1911/1915/1917 synthase